MKTSTFLALLLALLAAPAEAASSDWQDLGGGQARLLAQMDPATGRVEGLIQFELKPGWKTYWREPGGSGIPPIFDFSASHGFAAGEVAFPAPHVLSAGGSRFAGYKEAVSFVFSGEALSPGGSIVVDLMAGVCEEICIPATARLELPLSALNVSDAKSAMALMEARSRLPGEPREGMRVTAIEVDADRQLLVEAEAPSEGGPPELFVEGPQGWYFAQAHLLSAEDGKARFSVPIAGRPQDLSAPVPLTLTLTAGAAGAEQKLVAQPR